MSSDDIYNAAGWLVGSSTTILFVFMMAKRLKNQKTLGRKMALEPLDQNGNDIIGTAEDLHRAEQELIDEGSGFPAELIEKYEIIRRLSTLDGYRSEYIIDLIHFMQQSGVDCRQVFQQTLPTGEFSLNLLSGTYYLWVPRDQVTVAERLLGEFTSQ